MVDVALAVESAAALGSRIEYPVAARIRRAVGDTVLNDVNIDSGTQRFEQAFLSRVFYNFFYGKVDCRGIFAVEQSGSNPNFIGNFDLLGS
jgi:hypothetical protein